MSTLKADAVTTKSDNTDLTITGGGTGVPNLESGFKVGGTVEKLTGIAPSTSGNVLTSDGTDWTSAAAAGGGAWNFLSTVTASNSATVVITSGITSTYGHYMLTMTDVVPANDAVNLRMRTSTDGGSTYDSGSNDYKFIAQNRNDSATTYSADLGDTTHIRVCDSVGNAADEGLQGIIYFAGPSGTVINKLFRMFVWYVDSGNNAHTLDGVGMRDDVANVDAVQFYMASGNIASGVFRLYGLSNS